MRKKKFKHLPCLIIGNFTLLNKQLKFFKYNLKLKLIDKNFNLKKLNKKEIPIINVKYNQKYIFQKISKKTNNFIFNCFSEALNLVKEKKIIGFINGPISKETLFKSRFNGVTEYISSKIGYKNREVMLIYSKKLSVSPITTHIPVKKIHLKININKIIYKTKIISSFYKKCFNKKAKIAITGLNPHCYSYEKNSEEEKFIKPAIKKLKKQKINVSGPFSIDSFFSKKNIDRFDVIIGMYHDQVLTPLKTIKGLNAINVTLGLPFYRVSPEHGTA